MLYSASYTTPCFLLHKYIFSAYLPLFLNVECAQIVLENPLWEGQPLWLLSHSSLCFIRRHVSLKQPKFQNIAAFAFDITLKRTEDEKKCYLCQIPS